MSACSTTSPVLVNSFVPRAQDLVFYGASRFEAPEVGMKFRRKQRIFQVKSVRGERSGLGDFARTWKFIASCELVSER